MGFPKLFRLVFVAAAKGEPLAQPFEHARVRVGDVAEANNEMVKVLDAALR